METEEKQERGSPMKIEELRGVSRIRLCSVAKQVCHSPKSGNEKAWCQIGQRYIVVDCRDDSEANFLFPNEVEEYIQEVTK